MAQAALLSRIPGPAGGLVQHVQPQELAAVRQLAMPGGLQGFSRIAANRVPLQHSSGVKTFALFGSKAKPASKAPVSKKVGTNSQPMILAANLNITFLRLEPCP